MNRKVDKLTLNNFLRHADAHNKLQEEREMWRLRDLERKSEYEKIEWTRRAPLLTRGHLVSDTLDESDEGNEHLTPTAPSSTYWTRQLMKAEENDPFRWGHSGYKEQNPEEFVSTDDENNRNALHASVDHEKKIKDHKRKKHKKQKHKDTQSSDESVVEDKTQKKHKKNVERTNSKKAKKTKKTSTKAKK